MKKIYYKLCLLLFGMGLFCACEEEMTLKPDAGLLEGIVFDGYITNLAPPCLLYTSGYHILIISTVFYKINYLIHK